MNVKISVKKLFNMEQLIVSLKDGQRRYREQIAHMFSEHEDLKEKLTEAGCSLKRMDERIQAYMDENERSAKVKLLEQQVEGLKSMIHPAQVAAMTFADRGRNSRLRSTRC